MLPAKRQNSFGKEGVADRQRSPGDLRRNAAQGRCNKVTPSSCLALRLPVLSAECRLRLSVYVTRSSSADDIAIFASHKHVDSTLFQVSVGLRDSTLPRRKR
ncbi:hypothetical protein CEXT_540401 [Caerostris extrusa]|uniref:Uncharacterized protein n=1 Tax=Caerostris extrusa TaxID=172846 RepID=A0AAV4VN56_CAEEX|nr:hypothetical protein CEXT_540401 [Caerostris extrusa]